MKEKLLRSIAALAARRPGSVLIASLLVTVLATWQMSQLELRMHFKDLMPQSHPMVREFNRIVDDFSSASQIIVAASGQEAELKAFADALAPQLAAMDEYVRRVDYRLERDFYLNHGLMLVAGKPLDGCNLPFSQ